MKQCLYCEDKAQAIVPADRYIAIPPMCALHGIRYLYLKECKKKGQLLQSDNLLLAVMNDVNRLWRLKHGNSNSKRHILRTSRIRSHKRP